MPAIDREDGSVHYEVHGDGDPLVLLHGGWVSSRMWEPQVDRFADDHEVITVDLRGHGRTGRTSRATYSVPLYAADLRAVLERVDVGDPVLCGLSLGGHVAMTYAADHPIDGLVLAGTSRTVPPVPLGPLGRSLLAPRPVMHCLIGTMGVRAHYESLLAGVRTVEGHPWVGLRAETRRYVRSEVDTIGPAEYRKIFDALYDYRPPDLGDIDAPTLLVHGDHEATSVVRQNRTMASILGASRVEVPDAGHLVNLDNPRPFDAALATFLAAPQPVGEGDPGNGKGVIAGTAGS